MLLKQMGFVSQSEDSHHCIRRRLNPARQRQDERSALPRTALRIGQGLGPEAGSRHFARLPASPLPHSAASPYNRGKTC
jgi:hypothetical protein